MTVVNKFKEWCLNRSVFLTLILIAIIFAQAGNLFAQMESEVQKRDLMSSFQAVVPSDIVALDRPIDPNSYRLGPGDQMAIFIWGGTQGQYNLTITPEGKLLIPTIGPVNVAGELLADAKDKIKVEVMKRFKNVELNAELVNLRQFKVAIGGEVEFPGLYIANGATRVSEIINQAGGFRGSLLENPREALTLEPKVFPKGEASHRNILIKHTDGTVDTADVLLFELLGDTEFNFRVSDGDEILVPYREEKINLYGIFGGVKNPAFYEYSPRDSLTDLIELAHGLTLDSDSSLAELVSFASDGKTLIKREVELHSILKGTAPDIALHPDDRVFIKSINSYNEKNQVLLLGEVNNPGFYAIVPDSTSLLDVLEQAGGFTELASLSEAQMTRSVVKDKEDPEFERLRQMSVSEMDDLEYEYFKIKSREKPGRVSVDFEKLMSGKAKDRFKLQNGDVINIPRISEVVTVSGEVSSPGLLSYDPKYNYQDYIKQAGGFSFRADKGSVRIIKGVSGEWQKAKQSTRLSPGDIIMVPEKKKSRFFENLKEVMAFTANTAAVFLIIREATK